MQDTNDRRSPTSPEKEERQEIRLRVRPDLYRAFRRCVWMTIYETGMTPDDVHDMLIEDLLRSKGC